LNRFLFSPICFVGRSMNDATLTGFEPTSRISRHCPIRAEAALINVLTALMES